MKSRGRILRNLSIGAVLFASGAAAGVLSAFRQFSEPERPPAPLVVQLKSSFLERRPAIGDVSIRDMRPLAYGSPKHLVVARGLAGAPESSRAFEDELFGIFIFDAERGRLEGAIEIIPTPRLLDTEMRIEKLGAGEFEVVARSLDLGHVEWRRTYRPEAR